MQPARMYSQLQARGSQKCLALIWLLLVQPVDFTDDTTGKRVGPLLNN